MVFAIFLPTAYAAGVNKGPTPAIYWLSGLTCSDENFCQKAGPTAFQQADAEGIALIMPDTSPRGEGVANDDGYDLGQGAGFYIDSTQEPWSKHFKMESYIKELTGLVEKKWKVGSDGTKAVAGHSMGGHGALTLALKNPSEWTSVSAFAPICHPTACPWGEKAFGSYLGSVEAGKDHDAVELLLKAGGSVFDEIKIDEGTNDEFKDNQLRLADLEEAAAKVGQKLSVRRCEGHDHSYYFISSFIADHIEWHASRLRAAVGKVTE